MAVSFTPFKSNQLQSGGDTLQTQGANTIANHSTSSPYTVPADTGYVLVSFDTATTLTATPLQGENGSQVTGYSQRFENAGQTEIIGVIPGVTVITAS